jgi:molybdenum cofactor cytidylyltransferase
VREAAGDLLDDPRVSVVTNPDPARGMGSSLARGLEATDADAVMVLLADMPRVDADLTSRVVDLYRSGAARVAAPLVGERTGHPAILRADLFPALARLEGDRGARDIVEQNADRTALLDGVDPGTQEDVDVPEDLH